MAILSARDAYYYHFPNSDQTIRYLVAPPAIDAIDAQIANWVFDRCQLESPSKTVILKFVEGKDDRYGFYLYDKEIELVICPNQADYAHRYFLTKFLAEPNPRKRKDYARILRKLARTYDEPPVRGYTGELILDEFVGEPE